MKKDTDIKFTSNAVKVLERRYLKKSETGSIVEKPSDMFTRIAKAIAAADLNYGKSFSDMETLEREFYEMMTSLSFCQTVQHL
ncbi:Ribonucleotide reductase large subunit [Candidatus Magnetoovum chiemensis]|nr:Ribonucleotide reductase large subunit [Candidatus Magnetoovum chiemensis]